MRIENKQVVPSYRADQFDDSDCWEDWNGPLITNKWEKCGLELCSQVCTILQSLRTYSYCTIKCLYSNAQQPIWFFQLAFCTSERTVRSSKCTTTMLYTVVSGIKCSVHAVASTAVGWYSSCFAAYVNFTALQCLRLLFRECRSIVQYAVVFALFISRCALYFTCLLESTKL